MPKKFVLDTNVILHDPYAVTRFDHSDVIIPIYAIEEIDRFKRELSQLGRNARVFSRYIDELRKGGQLSDGVPIGENKGTLRVAFVSKTGRNPFVAEEGNRGDNLILATALQEQEADPDRRVVFVTRDINLRLRADAFGLEAVDYHDEYVDITELYSGFTDVVTSGQDVDSFYSGGSLPYENEERPLYPHQCVILRDEINEAHTGLGRYDAKQKEIVALRRLKDSVWGLRPRNKEQHFALELLLNDDVKLVSLVGMAGTGKTLLAIAAGLQKVIEERQYQKLLVSRPIFPLGRDVGFLPGALEEKLNPWMQPIYDNLELLLGVGHSDRNERSYREFLEMGYLEVEPLTYIRGRSIPNQFIIVDEAQNLTPHEVKTIITRVGDNTKIVLTGDPYQIDNPYIDTSNNGLSTVVERFKDAEISGHMMLRKGERSELAELAAKML